MWVKSFKVRDYRENEKGREQKGGKRRGEGRGWENSDSDLLFTYLVRSSGKVFCSS